MSYWGKRFIAVFLAVFLSVTLFVILGELSQRYYTEGLPVAKSGVVDLTSVDVTRQSVPLDGEWNFFPQAFLSSAQISSWLTAQQA